jgi:hypothetical protein
MIEGETIKWQPEKNKNTNNGLQNTSQKIKDWQHEPTKK